MICGACKDCTISSGLCIVLVATRNPLNIGAAARVMANFGLNDLRLVNPYEPSFREAVSAVGGAHVLQSARVFGTVADAVADCSLVVGTTTGQRRDLQQPIERLDAGMTAMRAHGGKMALLFGSEKFGLSNDDMSFCHALLRIPTSPETPSMNLAQAVAVCVYEHSRTDNPEPRRLRADAIESADSEQMVRMLMDVLEQSGYTNRMRAVSTERRIRRFVLRLRLSRRDIALIVGMLRQVLWKFRSPR